jgi:hypothetical protein
MFNSEHLGHKIVHNAETWKEARERSFLGFAGWRDCAEGSRG